MIKGIKVIPDYVKINDTYIKVEKSSKGFVRIGGTVMEIDRSGLVFGNINFEELLYDAFERCLLKAKKGD